MSEKCKLKDPNEVLDFKFDFASLTNGTGGQTDYLESGETITSQTTTAETGITVDSSSITDTNTSVTVWLSGGTVNTVYDITCNAVTSSGRTVERTRNVKVSNR